MGTRSFTDLEVYQTSRLLRKKVAVLVESNFPETEKYKLSDQIIRSSRRVTACIAEGYGRYYFKENIRFCRMARGSLLETLEHLITAFDTNYITGESLKDFKNDIDSCGRLINGYISYLKKSKPPKDED
ncbi:MAG: four helix bundle protein [Phycisphaerae bacterium]|nr:four helix bundle protein [Saprospiraceae bacterium]